MARARLLSRDASIDPALNGLSMPAQLLYLLSIPHLDRDGLIDGRPLVLVAVAAPLRTELRDGGPGYINEWVEAGLVVRYCWPDGHVLFFKGFRKHNKGLQYDRDSPSRYPPPPGFYRDAAGLVPDDPSLAAHLAACFGPASKYHTALLEHSQQVASNVIAEGQGQGHSQDQGQDQDQGQGHAAAAAGIDGHGPVSGNGDRAHAREAMRNWCGQRIDEQFGYGMFNDKEAYLDSLNDGEIDSLAGWLWKARERPSWVDNDGEPFGPGFFKRMVKNGQRAGLSPAERAGLVASLNDWEKISEGTQ